jgi:tetratricopeptide (TPR) repeat protein
MNSDSRFPPADGRFPPADPRRGYNTGQPPVGPQSPFEQFPEHLQPPRPGSRKWKVAIILMVLIAGAVALIATWLVPREMAGWHLAEAQEARADGDDDRAYAEMTEALRWLPEKPTLFLQRAAWRLEDEQFDKALDDVKEAESHQGNPYQVLSLKAQVLQHLGRHAEAIRAWEAIGRLPQFAEGDGRAMALNGVAYARAVGRLEIKEGLAEATEALNLAPGSAAVLDTHAFLLHLDGQNEKAIEEMNQAVEGMERDFEYSQQYEREDWRKEQMRNSRGLDLTGINKPETGVAVVRYHRALVLKALGKEEDAKKDLDRARELIGREPDETLF